MCAIQQRITVQGSSAAAQLQRVVTHSLSQGHFQRDGYIMGKNLWHSNQEMVLLSAKPSVPAAPVLLIKNIWHMQVIQLLRVAVRRGSFQDL